MNNSQSVLITSLWRLSIPSVYSGWTSSLDGPFSAFLLYVHSHWRCSHWKVTDFLLETTIWLRIYVVAFLYQDTQAWRQTEGVTFHCNASHIQQRCCQSRGFGFKSLSFQKTYKQLGKTAIEDKQCWGSMECQVSPSKKIFFGATAEAPTKPTEGEL